MPNLADQFLQTIANEPVTKQEGNFSLLAYSTVVGGCFPPYTSKFYSFHFGSLAGIHYKKHGAVFFSMERYRKTTEEAWRRYQKGKKHFVFTKALQVVMRDINRLYRDVSPSHIEKASDQKRERKLRQAFDLCFRCLAATVYCESIDEPYVKEIYESLRLPKKSCREFMHHAFLFPYKSFLTRKDETVLRGFNNNEELQYLFTDYYDAPAISHVAQILKRYISQEGGKKAIQKRLRKSRRTIATVRRALMRFKRTLTPQALVLLNFVQHTIYLRDMRRDLIQKFITVIFNIVRAYASRYKFPEKYIPFILYSECNSEKLKNFSYHKELAFRFSHRTAVVFREQGPVVSYAGVTAFEKKLRRSIQVPAGRSSTYLKGNTAFPGKVSGIARIIHSTQQFDKFKNEDILVTSMTRPEFIPLLKKAKAIITDEGGVTCHAAIVSREMHIPCITGTNNATHVLRSGMRLEVDATNGNVRVLKK